MSWRSYQSKTEGEMVINGALLGTVLEFGFGDSHFFYFLHKAIGSSRQTMGVGPYFTIDVPVLNLLTGLSAAELCSQEGKTFRFEGERVGKMELNWGRMACDDGEITRNILELKLSLRRRDNEYRITLVGQTGPVDPGSILEPVAANMMPCSFEVSCSLKRTHIEGMLAGHPLQAQLLERLS